MEMARSCFRGGGGVEGAAVDSLVRAHKRVCASIWTQIIVMRSYIRRCLYTAVVIAERHKMVLQCFTKHGYED